MAEEVIGGILRVLCFVRYLSRNLSIKNGCYEIESVGDHSNVKLYLGICHLFHKKHLYCLYLLKGGRLQWLFSHLSLPLHNESSRIALSVPCSFLIHTHTLICLLQTPFKVLNEEHTTSRESSWDDLPSYYLIPIASHKMLTILSLCKLLVSFGWLLGLVDC